MEHRPQLLNLGHDLGHRGVAHRINAIEDVLLSRQVAVPGLAEENIEKLRNMRIQQAAVFLDPASPRLTARFGFPLRPLSMMFLS